MKFPTPLLSCLSLLTLASAAPAALVLEEYFDYALSNNTNIGGNTGGAWLGGTNNVRYRTPPSTLAFSGAGYVASHAGGFLESGNSNSADYRGANAPLGATMTGEFWISAFVNPLNMTYSGGATAMMALNTSGTSNSSPGGPGFGLYSHPDTGVRPAIFTGIGPSGVLSMADTPIAAAAWYLLVARINIAASADDSVDFWVFGADADVPTTIAGLGTPTHSSSALNWGDSINTLNLGGQSLGLSGAKTAHWDDLRVSDLTGDAGLGEVLGIPEPSTYAALLAAGVLLLAARRRRT